MNYATILANTNPLAFKLINHAVDRDKAAQAYLFSAPRYYAIELEPLYLIHRLLNLADDAPLASYFDLVTIDGAAQNVAKEEVLNAISRLSQTSLSASRKKVLFIKNIEAGSTQSLNALLKFIEEPTLGTYIVLTTNHINRVLSTIKSRAQVISLRAMPRAQFVSALVTEGLKTHEAEVLSLLTDSPLVALKLQQETSLWSDYQALTSVLEGLERKPRKTLSDLAPLLRKDNYLVMAKLLVGFANDIWKSGENLPLTLHAARRAASHYHASHFDYARALTALNDFVLDVANNSNFDLAKIKFLLTWEACYG